MPDLQTETPVFERIRHAILDGVWTPGHRLAPAALAERFATSTTVVREALTRLLGENLVAAKTNRGFFIPELNLREFEDVTNCAASPRRWPCGWQSSAATWNGKPT